MATHSSVLAWRIPGMGEPGRLPSVYGVAQSQTRLKRLSSSCLSEARGGGREDQPHIQGAVAARAQEGLEELSHIEGQEGRR